MWIGSRAAVRLGLATAVATAALATIAFAGISTPGGGLSGRLPTSCVGLAPRTLYDAGGQYPEFCPDITTANCLLIAGSTNNCLLISGSTTNALLVR